MKRRARKCIFRDCGKRSSARGMCSVHYIRWVRSGHRDETDVADAELEGYSAGLRGSERCKDYRTGQQYIAWYEGWRRGQSERRKAVA